MQKKILNTALILSTVFFIAGCVQKEPVSPARTVQVQQSENTPQVNPIAYPLRVSMWLYELPKDTGAETDETKAVEALILGETLTVLSEEPRKATNVYDNRVYNYIRVRRDTKKEGLVFANQIALGGKLAVVVTEKANLYRTAKNAGVTGNTLPLKTILVIYPETAIDGFIEFQAYDPVDGIYRNGLFIKAQSVSSSETDVQSSILLQTALALDASREAGRRTALLEAAFSDYPDSAFASEIRGLVSPGAAIADRPSSFSFAVVNDDNVNVREQPAAAAPVKGRLSLGTEVPIDKETVEADNIDGAVFQWFHITSPQEGWVFGAFLE